MKAEVDKLKKVSVIIPAYNNEKKIKRCLSSIAKQTYSNIEIIIVEDGSTDHTLSICKELQKKDVRIRIIEQQHRGVEQARLVGRLNTSGYYLMYVDSDDWLSKNAVQILVTALEKNKADVCVGNYTRVLGSNGIFRKVHKNNEFDEKILTGSEIVRDYYGSFSGCGNLPVQVWGKLYKRSLFDEERIKLAGVFYGDDICLNMQVLPNADRIVFIPENVYFYRWGGMTTKINEIFLKDTIRQYYFKGEIYEKARKNDCLDIVGLELLNSFFGFIEYQVVHHPYNWDQTAEKIERCLNLPALLSAVKSVPNDPQFLKKKKVDGKYYDWTHNYRLFKAAKDQDIDYLVTASSKKINFRKSKRKILGYLDAF